MAQSRETPLQEQTEADLSFGPLVCSGSLMCVPVIFYRVAPDTTPVSSRAGSVLRSRPDGAGPELKPHDIALPGDPAAPA
jgi:hypothetical protein